MVTSPVPRDENLTAEQHEQKRRERHELFVAHQPVIDCISPVLKAESWDKVPKDVQERLYPALKALSQEHPFIHHSQRKYFDRTIYDCLSTLNPETFEPLGPVQKHAAVTPHLQRLLDLLEASRTQHITMAAYHGKQVENLRNAR